MVHFCKEINQFLQIFKPFKVVCFIYIFLHKNIGYAQIHLYIHIKTHSAYLHSSPLYDISASHSSESRFFQSGALDMNSYL